MQTENDTPKPEDSPQQETGEGCSGATCYRLLDHNDMIRADDEFLEDDCVTWTLIGIQHRWTVGHYWHTALKPMRRILGDNVQNPSTP
jgi:hypothetical protein